MECNEEEKIKSLQLKLLQEKVPKRLYVYTVNSK